MDLEVNFKVKKIETSEDSEKKLNNEGLKCENFTFTTISKKGLKTHQKRKHSILIQETLTITCERCESKFENVKDLLSHMKIHTQAKYLCDECDFVALNYRTVGIHEGKEHDKFTCGLCDYKTKDINTTIQNK